MFTLKTILILIGRNLLILLTVTSIAAALIIFISGKIEILSNSTALNHHLKSELENRIALFEVIKQDAEIVGSNGTVIEAAFVPSDDISVFIDTLDALAKDMTLVQNYRFDTPAVSTISAGFLISSILYSNGLTTNIANFSSYLKEFERLPYFTKIEGFSISSQNELGWLGTSTISIHATLYTKETK